MAAAAVIYAFEVLAIRIMTARGIPIEMQLLSRAAGQLLWVAPAIVAEGLAIFRTRRPGLHLLRGVSSLVTWVFYYFSFTRLDMATGTVLSFTNVMFTTLLAAPILGEKVDGWRWAGTLIGFAGVVIMLRPGAAVDALGAAAALAAALTWCGITLSSRALGRTESTRTVVAWVGLVTVAGTAPFALLAWVPVGVVDALVMLSLAIVGPGIVWLVVEALRHGEASAIAPIQYLRLVIVALAGWVFFGEAPDGWGWLGGGVILAGAVVVTVAEARRR